MLRHALEHAAEKLHGVDDERALVEHYAFRASAHRRIGDLGARRDALLRQVLQHLCGPDHRHVRRLAHQQDLFLNLGEARVWP